MQPYKILELGDEAEVILVRHKNGKPKQVLKTWHDLVPGAEVAIAERYQALRLVSRIFSDHFPRPLGLEGLCLDEDGLSLDTFDSIPLDQCDTSAVTSRLDYLRLLRVERPVEQRPRTRFRYVDTSVPPGFFNPNEQIASLRSTLYDSATWINQDRAFALLEQAKVLMHAGHASLPPVLLDFFAQAQLFVEYRRALLVGERPRFTAAEQCFLSQTYASPRESAFLFLDELLIDVCGRKPFYAFLNSLSHAGVEPAHPAMNYALVYVPESERERFPRVAHEDFRLGLDKTEQYRIVFFELAKLDMSLLAYAARDRKRRSLNGLAPDSSEFLGSGSLTFGSHFGKRQYAYPFSQR